MLVAVVVRDATTLSPVVGVRSEWLAWVGAAGWLAVAALGFGVWHAYDATPGPPAAAAEVAAPPTGRWRVVTYLHPHCPCSLATVGELTGLVNDLGDPIDVEIVFVRPVGVPTGWERGRLWDRAAGLKWANVRTDEGGAEVRAAGVTTSGQAVVTDPDGRVVFRGGLSRGRGLAGDNSGRRAVAAWLAGDPHAPGSAPVFGCRLTTDDEGCERGGGACPK